MSRDPLGMWGDAGQRGNAQSYCRNNPVNRVDPMGDLDEELRRAVGGLGSGGSVEGAYKVFARRLRAGTLGDEAMGLYSTLSTIVKKKHDLGKLMGQRGLAEAALSNLNADKATAARKRISGRGELWENAELKNAREVLDEKIRKQVKDIASLEEGAQKLAKKLDPEAVTEFAKLSKHANALGDKALRAFTKLGKVAPGIALLVGAIMFPSKVEAKGFGYAVWDEALDQCPGVGAVKGIGELAVGHDLIDSKEKRTALKELEIEDRRRYYELHEGSGVHGGGIAPIR